MLGLGSSLWFNFAHGIDKPDSVMGFGDSKTREIEANGKKIKITLYYGANLERFSSTIEGAAKELATKSYKHCTGIILLYDVSNEESLNHAKVWKDAFVAALTSEELVASKFLLLGNKIDKEDERVVSTEDGKKVAQDIGSLFAEVSATTGTNVVEVITSFASAILQ